MFVLLTMQEEEQEEEEGCDKNQGWEIIDEAMVVGQVTCALCSSARSSTPSLVKKPGCLRNQMGTQASNPRRKPRIAVGKEAETFDLFVSLKSNRYLKYGKTLLASDHAGRQTKHCERNSKASLPPLPLSPHPLLEFARNSNCSLSPTHNMGNPSICLALCLLGKPRYAAAAVVVASL